MKRIVTMFIAISALAISTFAAPLSAATCCCCQNAAAAGRCGDTCTCCKH
jgi:hypothetical protein